MAIPAEKIMVEPSSGRIISFLGNQVTFKIEGGQTSGAFSIIEALYPPGNFTPPHRHEKTDEVGYILEGELGVMVAEEDFRAGPGTFFVRPKGRPPRLEQLFEAGRHYDTIFMPELAPRLIKKYGLKLPGSES
jgi:quercetin dioxygenase-like cupin family protein